MKFETLEEEVNFIAVLSLLCVGGGIQADLQLILGQGAHATMNRGLISMYLAVSQRVLSSRV